MSLTQNIANQAAEFQRRSLEISKTGSSDEREFHYVIAMIFVISCASLSVAINNAMGMNGQNVTVIKKNIRKLIGKMDVVEMINFTVNNIEQYVSIIKTFKKTIDQSEIDKFGWEFDNVLNDANKKLHSISKKAES